MPLVHSSLSQNESEIHLKDPRIPKTSYTKYPLELPVPRFKIDENYVGTPPAIEVSIMNLNDNIRKDFLREKFLLKFGAIEKIQIMHHPLTNQHLGLAKVTYYKPSAASKCVEKLNGQSVMGNVLSVFHDPFAKRITEHYHEIVNPTQNFNVPTVSDHEHDHDSAKKDGVDGKIKLSNGYKSPTRECLEWRISHMIRDPKITSKSPLFKSIKRLRDSMQDDEKEDLLKMPPSPFLSLSHYTKWNRITREIERGSDQFVIERLVQGESDREDQHYDDMDMSCSSEESNHGDTANHSSQNFKESSFQRLDSQQQQHLPQYKFSTFGQHQNGGQPAPILNSKPHLTFSLGREASSSSKDNRDKKPDLFTLSDRKRLCDRAITDTYDLFIKELEDIMVKDIYKKITENYSFKLFDNWWDDQEKVQAESKNTPIKPMEELDNARLVTSFNSRIDTFIREDHNNDQLASINLPMGLARGLRAAMPKMPSFKKKTLKLSPRREEFSDSEGENSHMEDRSKKFKTPAQRRKMQSPMSQSSKSAASQSDNDDPTADSDSSKDSSDSSSESSDSEASSSSSASSSEEDEESDSESTADEEKQSLVSSRSPQSISVSESQNSTSQAVSPSRSDSISSPKSIPEPSVVPSVDDEEDEDGDDEEEEEEDEDDDVEDSQDSQDAQVDIGTSEKDGKDVADLTSVSQDVSQRDVDMLSDNDLSDALEDAAESYHGSSTDTADETVAELNRLEEIEKQKNKKKTKKRSTQKESLDEMEVSQLLISLASGGCEDKSQGAFSLRDPISQEHNYARLPLIPKKRGRKPKPESEKKPKGKGKKVQDENLAPDLSALYQLGAVATEMRKAKLGLKKIDDVEEKKEIVFPPRLESQEEIVFMDIISNGMDHEDRSYLKRSFEQLIAEENEEDLAFLKKVTWMDHPTTVSAAPSPPKKRKGKEERIHKTGSARTEGYYKIGFLEKQKYSHVANTGGPGHVIPDETITRVRQMVTTNQLSREARQNQRRLLATVDSAYTDLLKFSQLKFRKKQLKFSKSVIHDWGLFALEPIAADEMIIEYVGERIRPLVADIREKKYEECGIGSSYLFRVDGECIVDATKCGNVARFINHSCMPNCYAKVVTVEGSKKIVIYSKQQIAVGDEITYDYKFPIEEDNKISCLCGAQGCRGYLN